MASLVSNSIATLIARLLVPAFSFAISVTIARLYGAAILGEYVQLMALAVIFQTAAAAGIPLLLTRDLAAHPENSDELLRHAQSFALVSGFVSTCIFLAYGLWVLPAHLMWAALALAFTLLPSAWMAIQEGYFMATRTHHRLTLIAMLENSLKLALAALVFVAGGGIAAICAAIGLARLVAAGLGSRLVRKAGADLRFQPSLQEGVGFARLVLPFAVLLTVSMAYFRIDILLVGLLVDEQSTGLYGAAVMLYTVSILLLSSVMSAVYPRLSSAFRVSQDGFADATMLTVKVLALGMVPIAILMICFADMALAIVFGDPFRGAAPVLRLLAASLPLHGINGSLGQALQAGQLQTSMMRVVTTGLVVHVVGIAILVPRFGIEGAAMSVLISSMVVTLGSARAFHRNVTPAKPSVRSFFSLVAVIAPIIIVFSAPHDWIIPAASIAFVVFFVTVLGGALSAEERVRLMRVVVRPKAGAAI